MTPIKSIHKMHYPDVVQLIQTEASRLGSQSRVAVKCDVSPATINNMVNGVWDAISPKMWNKVAAALDWRPVGWNVVETTNTRMLHQVFTDAKQQSMWLAISSPAGSSKTSSARTFAAINTQNVFYLECDEWSRGHFLKKFAQSIGVPSNSYPNSYELLDEIIRFLQTKSNDRPLVILDQVDKLYDQAMRTLIPIFNGLEDKVGVVIMGVGHIKKRMRRNVANQQCGWDEIESRFGRTYIATPGATRSDVRAICQGNGIDDAETIKLIWAEIWNDEKGRNTIAGRDVKVIKDMRRLKRCIQRELLILSENSTDTEDEPAPELEAATA